MVVDRFDDLTWKQVVVGGVVLSLVLVVAVTSVQVLGDPGAPDPASVDLSESPNEIAVDALRDASGTSHTIDIIWEDPGGGIHSYVAWYEPDEKEYMTERLIREGPPSEDPPPGFYVAENGVWANASGEGWQRSKSYSFDGLDLYNSDPLGDAPVTVHRENETTLILVADLTNTTVNENIVPGSTEDVTTLHLVIDKEQRHLQRVVAEEPTGKQVRVELSGHGSTNVERPDEVPTFSLDILWYDIRHGPLSG